MTALRARSGHSRQAGLLQTVRILFRTEAVVSVARMPTTELPIRLFSTGVELVALITRLIDA
jgi:hypothetical protein